MRAIACLLLVLFVSLAWFGICNGAVWFEGYDPQEPQEIRLLNVEHKIPVSRYTATPVCSLILSEAEPQIVSLTIVVTTWAMGYQNENFETWLSVDSKEPEKLFGTLDVTPSAAGESYQRQYDVTLSGLGDGTHLIEIRIAGEYDSYYGVGNYDCEGSVSVIIDTIPPKVSILSLENETYSAASIPLNFTTSEPISQSTYSLDGQENVTIAGNTTLSELTTGDHNITVYATDEAGNIGASDTIYFSVEVPEPFPTTLVVASVITVAAVGIGLLFYFKKRKR
jgi:hypothetical protein